MSKEVDALEQVLDHQVSESLEFIAVGKLEGIDDGVGVPEAKEHLVGLDDPSSLLKVLLDSRNVLVLTVGLQVEIYVAGKLALHEFLHAQMCG